jgi:hypothetical protein
MHPLSLHVEAVQGFLQMFASNLLHALYLMLYFDLPDLAVYSWRYLIVILSTIILDLKIWYRFWYIVITFVDVAE